MQRLNQREIRHYAELQLINEVETMLKSYLYIKDPKIRRFDVYSHLSCYLDVLDSNISQFMPKNMQIYTLTPEMMKWKLFLSEINENK